MDNIDLLTNRRRIGQRIAIIRKQKELTTEQLGELAGIRQQNISRIESGLYSTGIDLYYKIAGALGVELKELF